MNSRPTPRKAQPNDRSAARASKSSDRSATARQTQVFKPERTHLLALALMFAIIFIIVAWAPKYLFWLLLLPLIGAWWVLRAQTTVGEKGIAIRYAFRGDRQIAWEDLDGVGFQRARAFANTKSGDKYTLPGVTFNSLPDLAEASRGRVPDALTAGQEAADEKVVVIHRDGQQVMMSKEEYAEYQKTHPEAGPPTRAK